MKTIKFIKDTEKNKIGDIAHASKKSADNYISKGYAILVEKKRINPKDIVTKTKQKNSKVRILDKPKLVKKPKKDIKHIKNPKSKDLTQALKQIIDRHKELEGDSYIEVFAGDDKKTQKQIYSNFFDIRTKNINEIQKEFEVYNIGSYGVFLNINPLCDKKRIKANIKKILYIFIDLDDAKYDHNEIIKTTLEKYNITYSYNAKSGHGFHFLIPVDLETSMETKVKGFLTYLKENICDKVDIATFTNERLMRCPLSYHNKDDVSKELITLHNHYPSYPEIKTNSENILKYQFEQKKGVKDIAYQNSIKKEDIFFSSILNDKNNWSKYYEILNVAINKHDVFIKNLGFFIYNYPDFSLQAEAFLANWEPVRITAMNNWCKKAAEHNTNVLYFELLKWSKQNKLKYFTDLLLEQTQNTFLDNYEVYYLEDEKKENAYLLYYPDKNYYVQKALPDVLQTIYYDARESGIDLVKELNLNLLDDWETFGFKKQLTAILTGIHKKLEEERRIKMVFNINYEPTENKFIYFNKKKFFNTYNKTAFWDYNKEQQKYGFPHIKELIMNLVGNDEKSYNYFNNWLGWQIQNPTEKLPTAIILQGRQGSGKGTFKTHILDNIFGENCQEINQTHLESSFNEYLLGKQIIVANEVMHNENRLTLPNILKNLVTDPEITISRKFRKEITGKNFTHWIFCTNSDNPIRIEEDDRRYSVFYSEKLKGGGKAAAIFVNNLRTNLDYELKEYISYLKSLNILYSDVHEPIMTDAKEEIIDLNKNSVQRFLEYFNNFHDLDDCFATLDGLKLSTKETNDGGKVILTDLFYLAYKNYCKKFDEKGIFNKQTFSKQLSNKSVKSDVKYIPDEKKNHRIFAIDDIKKVISISIGGEVNDGRLD